MTPTSISTLRAWALVGLALSVLPLHSGETEVHFRDGKTYLVHTSLGVPVSYSDKEIDEVSIQPTIQRPGEGQPWELCWSVRIKTKRSVQRTIDIEPDSTPAYSFSGEFVGWGSSPPYELALITGKTSSGQVVARSGLIFAYRPQAPKLWEWISGRGDSWIPFKFHIRHTTDSTVSDFIQWVRLTESSREQLTKRLAELVKYDQGEPTNFVDLKGITHSIPCMQGYPVHFRSPNFSIKNLGLSVGKGSDGKPMFSWALDGFFPAKRNAEVTITLRDFPDVPVQHAHLDNLDQFRFICADSIHFPRIWEWLKTPEDTWLAFVIRIEGTDKEPIEAEQWVRMAEADKKRIREVLKAEGFP